MNWLEYCESIARVFLGILAIMVSFGVIVVEIQWKKMGPSTIWFILFLVAGALIFAAGVAKKDLLMMVTGVIMFTCVSFIFVRRLWHRLHRPREINPHERPQGFLFSTMREDTAPPKK